MGNLEIWLIVTYSDMKDQHHAEDRHLELFFFSICPSPMSIQRTHDDPNAEKVD